jgi:hypothetical protein
MRKQTNFVSSLNWYNIIELPCLSDNIIELPCLSDSIIELPCLSDNIIELPCLSDNIIELPCLSARGTPKGKIHRRFKILHLQFYYVIRQTWQFYYVIRQTWQFYYVIRQTWQFYYELQAQKWFSKMTDLDLETNHNYIILWKQ